MKSYILSVCSFIILLKAVVLIVPAVAGEEPVVYEDLKPAVTEDWRADSNQVEDITPLPEKPKTKHTTISHGVKGKNGNNTSAQIKARSVVPKKKKVYKDMSWNTLPERSDKISTRTTKELTPKEKKTKPAAFDFSKGRTEDTKKHTATPEERNTAASKAGKKDVAGEQKATRGTKKADAKTGASVPGSGNSTVPPASTNESPADVAEAAGGGTQTEKETEEKPTIKVRRRPLGPISGDVRIKYQTANASGNEIGFLSSNGLLFFNDKLQQSTKLRIDKKFDNGLKVNGVFTDIPYQDQYFHVNVSSKNGYAKLGDVQAEFRGGPMTGFKKQIRGLDINYDFGSVEVAAMASKEKSTTSRENFHGNNIRGPYVLRANSILNNSETVYLNGSPLSRGAYNMDYFLGQITFNFIVDPTDLIEITYESVQQVSIRTGDLNGISVKADPGWNNVTLGVAYLEEGTARTAETTTYEIVEEFSGETFATDTTVYLKHDYVKVYSESVLLLAGSTQQYLSRDTDYTIDYFTGSVSFSNMAASATSEVRISYSYYNRDYLQRIDGEELYGYGEAEYILSREWVYPGPEVVYLYVNENMHRELKAGEDYEINPANNSIVFLDDDVTPNDNTNQYVVISYEIVPEPESASGDSKRRLFDMTGGIRIGPHRINAEFAETTSDITLKTVQVLEERVATVGEDSGRVFPLQFDAIPNTEAVYFNDTVLADSRQRAGVDYILEYDPSFEKYVLRFVDDVPVGTTIIASYKYIPLITTGVEKSGAAGRVTGDFLLPFGTLTTEYMKKSAYFSPLTSFNDLEHDRLAMDFKMSPKRNLFFNLKYRSQTYLADMHTGVEFDDNTLTTAVEYRFKPGARAALLFENNTYSDNRPVSLTNIEKKKIRTEIKYPFGKKNKVVTEFYFENRNQDDATDRTSDRDVTKAGLAVNYSPNRNFRLKLATDNSRAAFVAPPGVDPLLGNFSTRTLSNVLGLTYIPVPLWTITANLDTQSTRDSRNLSNNSSIRKISAAATSKQIGIVEGISLSFNRTDRPNPIHGDTSTEAENLSVKVAVAKDWTVTPWLSRTKAGVEQKSRSESRTVGARAGYRSRAKRGWSGTAMLSANNGKTSTLGSTTDNTWSNSTSDQTRTELTTKYVPGERLEWRNAFTFTRSGSSTSRNSYSSNVDYKYSTSTRISLLLNMEETTYTRTKYQLRSDTRLDDHFSLGLSFKKENQSGANDYSGTLFNMALDIKF